MRRPSRPRRSKSNLPCLIEPLERRALLAVDVVGGALVVTGTNRGDTIALSLSADDPAQVEVRINNTTTTRDLSLAPNGIRVHGGNGNDRISASGDFTIPVTLLGGNGQDTLIGGAGDDLLSGGNGKDSLTGGAGDDTLLGGNGNDTLLGFSGDDSLGGDAGNDVLRGGNGKDICQGGAGNDRAFGDGGNDTLRGDANDDSLAGGAGDDSLLGGNGNDTLRGDDGDDECDGQSGRDDVDGGRGADHVAGGFGIDRVRGGQGRDRFRGDDRNDEIRDRGKDDDDDLDIAPSALPASVNNSLQQVFPGAVVTRAEIENRDGRLRGYEVRFSLDGLTGKAEFNADGQLREAEIPFALLPQPVQDAFNAAHGGATVTRVQIERASPAGELLYKVRYLSGDRERKALFTGDGTLVSDDGPGFPGGGDDDDDDDIAFGDLPAPVRSALNRVAPGATYEDIERETEDGQIVYKVKLFTANGTERRYELLANGTFVD